MPRSTTYSSRSSQADCTNDLPSAIRWDDTATCGPRSRSTCTTTSRTPLARLDLIRAETCQRKRLDDADELYDPFHALGRVEHVGSAAHRLAGGPREFAVSISNVPGPRDPISIAGRRVLHLFSSSEPALHHALRISAVSCAGDIGIGLCTDPSALPDVARLAECIEASYTTLRDAAGGAQHNA
jgi:diacylglycerol O-acyltransferase